MNYLLVKEDKKVSITKNETGWSYKKEFGSSIIENFDISNDKLSGLLMELDGFGYKVIEKPEEKIDPKAGQVLICIDGQYSYEDPDNLPQLNIIRKQTDAGIFYYKGDSLHREDGPAIERANGVKEWYKNGKLHREDGPAVEWRNGTKEWYYHGKLHREDGPAYISDYVKEWRLNGKLHREDGPAHISEYSKEWYINGKRHREAGPAVEWSDGGCAWFLNDIRYTEEQFLLEKASVHLNRALESINNNLISSFRSM